MRLSTQAERESAAALTQIAYELATANLIQARQLRADPHHSPVVASLDALIRLRVGLNRDGSVSSCERCGRTETEIREAGGWLVETYLCSRCADESVAVEAAEASLSNEPEEDADRNRGLYSKFTVTRTNPDAEARHQGCDYFVLDLTDDPHAAAAIAAYAYSCRDRRLRVQLPRRLPLLAADLDKRAQR